MLNLWGFRIEDNSSKIVIESWLGSILGGRQFLVVEGDLFGLNV
jgi:hypothetical protein